MAALAIEALTFLELMVTHKPPITKTAPTDPNLPFE
jgi:hypothetical protein